MGIAFKKFKLRQVSEKISADDFTETAIPETWIAEEFLDIPAVILRPTIDKLVVRYNLQDIKNKAGAKGAILEKLNSLSSSSKHPEYKAIPQDKKGFYNNFELTPPDANSSVLIQLNPVKKSNHFMRLTFNPTKLTKQGVAFLISEIEKFSDGHIKYDSLAKTKNTIADIHIAVDILGIALDDMEVRYYKDSKSKLFTSDTGRKQSQYLNFTKDTKSIAYVYDKRRELIDNQQKPKYKNALHVRVERRIETDTHDMETLVTLYAKGYFSTK